MANAGTSTCMRTQRWGCVSSGQSGTPSVTGPAGMTTSSGSIGMAIPVFHRSSSANPWSEWLLDVDLPTRAAALLGGEQRGQDTPLDIKAVGVTDTARESI